MSINPFSKKKKLKKQEKGHREPIVVKFFKEKDSQDKMHISIDDENAEQDGSKDESGFSADGTKKRRAKFVPNDKYFTVTVYAVMALLAVVLFGVILSNITPVMEAVKRFLHVLSPFIIGAIIAFILTPIVNFLDASLFEKTLKIKKAKVRAGLSIALTYIVFIGLLVLVMMKLVPEVSDSISELISKSKNIYSSITHKSDSTASEDIVTETENNVVVHQNGSDSENSSDKVDVEAIFNNIKENGLQGLIDEAKRFLPSVLAKISDKIPSFVTGTFNWLKSIVTTLINILLGIAVSIYMVCDKRRIAGAGTKLVYCVFKAKTAQRVIETSKESFQIFIGFIIGKSIDSLIIGILTFFMLKIFGLPYELLVAVIVGVTNMIPFFGPLIGAIPGILLYLCIDPIFALIFVIMILGIQQFDGWILGPMILGDSTGIRPIWVIFGITVGGAYFGFTGMFLGVPVTAVIVYLVNKAVDKKLSDKHIEVS